MLIFTPREVEYGFSRSNFLDIRTPALAAGANDSLLAVFVPLDEIWEVITASLHLSTGAVGTQTGQLFIEQVNNLGVSTGFAIALGDQITLRVNPNICIRNASIILGPGTGLHIQTLNAGLNDVVALRMYVLKFQRAFYGQAISI